MPIDDPAPAIDGSEAQAGHRDIEKVDFSTIAPEPSPHFTGAADLRRITGGLELARLAHVTFHHGAQTNWHHHTGPQWLVFLEGSGEVIARSGKRLSCDAGDVVRIDPCLSHRHGAVVGGGTTHLAVTVGETEWEDEC